MALLEVVGLKKTYPTGETALRGIDLAVDGAEVIAVLGLSGSGKSTLLRVINWLLPPDAGQVYIDGEQVGETTGQDGRTRPRPEREINAVRARVGMLFQNFNVWPHMSTLENVTRPQVVVLKRTRAESESIALALLNRVGLGNQVRLCKYTNYCEGLDQKHKQVTCELWDRENLEQPGISKSHDGKRRLLAPVWSPPVIEPVTK